jgi:hypothetical protein
MPFALPLLLTLWLPGLTVRPEPEPSFAPTVRVEVAPLVTAWSYGRDDASEGFEGESEPNGHGTSSALGPDAPGSPSPTGPGQATLSAHGPPCLPLLRLGSRLNC